MRPLKPIVKTPSQLNAIAKQMVDSPSSDEAAILKQRYLTGFYGVPGSAKLFGQTQDPTIGVVGEVPAPHSSSALMNKLGSAIDGIPAAHR